MLITHLRLLMPCLTAVVLAGGIASYAQTGSPQTDSYLVKLRAENTRHDQAMKKIKDEEYSAREQQANEETDCRLKTGTAKKTCLDTAKSNYDNAMTPILKEANHEEALHRKNINDLERTTDVPCTRPDCANAPRQRTTCTGGSCTP
jgi:hypothetical protein